MANPPAIAPDLKELIEEQIQRGGGGHAGRQQAIAEVLSVLSQEERTVWEARVQHGQEQRIRDHWRIFPRLKDGLRNVVSQYMGDIVGQGANQTDAAAIHVYFGARNPIGLLEHDQFTLESTGKATPFSEFGYGGSEREMRRWGQYLEHALLQETCFKGFLPMYGDHGWPLLPEYDCGWSIFNAAEVLGRWFDVMWALRNRDGEGPPLDWCAVHADRQRYVPEAWINELIADPKTLLPDELVSLYKKLYDAQYSGGAFGWKVAA